MPATGAKKRISIDFPTPHERVTAPRYTVRLSAALGPAESVADSVDDSPNKGCRFASGHWWIDWDVSRSHLLRLLARFFSAHGYVVSVAARRLFFALGDDE